MCDTEGTSMLVQLGAEHEINLCGAPYELVPEYFVNSLLVLMTRPRRACAFAQSHQGLADPPMSCSFSWVGMKQIIFRTLIIEIAYANMSYYIVFTLQCHTVLSNEGQLPDPQWVYKIEVYCVRSKC